MGMKDSIKKVLVKLGENNKPTYAVMAIAVVKGIARPLFTMSDKHADPETKKYTAIREGLTEVVAIPTYFACGELAGKVANKLNLSPEKKALARSNFMFLGVCAAALVVIPALASITIKPFMNKIQNGNKSKEKINEISNISEQSKFNSVKKESNFKAKKTMTSYYSNPIQAQTAILKVGGL